MVDSRPGRRNPHTPNRRENAGFVTPWRYPESYTNIKLLITLTLLLCSLRSIITGQGLEIALDGIQPSGEPGLLPRSHWAGNRPNARNEYFDIGRQRAEICAATSQGLRRGAFLAGEPTLGPALKLLRGSSPAAGSRASALEGPIHNEWAVTGGASAPVLGAKGDRADIQFNTCSSRR